MTVRGMFGDSLDDAWSEAEAAERETRRGDSPFDARGIVLFYGWNSEYIVMMTDRDPYLSEAVEDPRIEVTGPTPAAALRALTAKLRERAG